MPADASPLRKLALFVGPGLLVSVGYMDPGNWATAIEAGSRFGYASLFVVDAGELFRDAPAKPRSAPGIATGRDLARSPGSATALAWRVPMAAGGNCSIVATDLAEVLGAALAFHLLLLARSSITTGVVSPPSIPCIVLAPQGANFRRLEPLVRWADPTIGAVSSNWC
ncbi:divalent metal cation transporter [Pseudomonas aeruginosa]